MEKANSEIVQVTNLHRWLSRHERSERHIETSKFQERILFHVTVGFDAERLNHRSIERNEKRPKPRQIRQRCGPS